MPETARRDIDTHRLAVLRGDPDVDPLDGHALLTRLKVAAALMALDGRTAITDEDWQLAGTVMRASVVTREMCRRALDDQTRRTNQARALSAAERDEFISDRKLARCREGIERSLAKLDDGEHIARHDLRRKIRADLRAYFDTAVAELIDGGKVTEIRQDGGTAYRRCTRVHGGTRPSTSEKDPCTDGTRVHRSDNIESSDQRKRDKPQPPPGARTDSTPGVTESVQQTSANVRNNGGRPQLCTDCGRAPARPDTGLCDLCTMRHSKGVELVQDVLGGRVIDVQDAEDSA